MTQHNVAATWTWTGGRDIPDWLDRHHHWHTDRPVIHTTDGPRTLYDGWMAVLWTDGAITVASNTVAERVYGPDGIAGRLAAAEKTLARIQAIADEYPAGIDTALIHAALDPLTPAEEARLAQSGIDTPGCDCGHEGMGVSWHGDDCVWRRQQVDPAG